MMIDQVKCDLRMMLDAGRRALDAAGEMSDEDPTRQDYLGRQLLFALRYARMALEHSGLVGISWRSMNGSHRRRPDMLPRPPAAN
jgi:hypothetical protein